MPAKVSFDTSKKIFFVALGVYTIYLKQTYKRKKMRKRKTEGSKQC